jgi:hypothetical protein
MLRRVIAFFALIVAAFAAPPVSAQTLFEGARLIPGDGSAAVEDAGSWSKAASLRASAGGAGSRCQRGRAGSISPARP